MARRSGRALSGRRPNIALRYPKLKSFLNVRADIAARGVETRKKNRAAKKPA